MSVILRGASTGYSERLGIRRMQRRAATHFRGAERNFQLASRRSHLRIEQADT